MEIVKAGPEHMAEVGRLFDLYRQFYDCPPDLELATRFVTERTERDESDIFVALDEANPTGRAMGMVQLYPSFCSVQAVKIYVLYDLYVDADKRRNGVGEALMVQAADWATSNGASRLDLLTAHDNLPGQRLYERMGWAKANEKFHAYQLQVGG